MADSKEKLFSDFIAPTRQEWLDKINVDLKGADYQKKWSGEPMKGSAQIRFTEKKIWKAWRRPMCFLANFPT